MKRSELSLIHGRAGHLTKSLSALLAIIYFATNCAFAYSPETNLWEARRKASQLAGLPLSRPPSPAEIIQNISRQENRPPASSLSESLAHSLPEGFDVEHSSVFKSLPYAYGQIRKVSVPQNPSGKLVIHIQDVHLNPEAQANIGKILQALISQKQIDLIALEGAFDRIDLSGFRSFPDPDGVGMAADYMLREQKISGAIYAALTSPQGIPPVFGIDDRTHYQANVEAYRQSAEKIDGEKKLLAQRANDLSRRKAAVFNPELADLDKLVEAHRRGELSLADHIRGLAKYSRRVSPAVKDFLAALRMESQLDFRQVEKERGAVIGELARKLNPREMDELLSQSVAYRLGQMRFADFYSLLQTFCQNNGVDLSHLPALQAYIRYVLLSDRIQAETLIPEIQRMEKEAFASLAKTASEQELVRESDKLYLTGKLLDFALTPEEWREYCASQADAPGEKVQSPRLSSFEDFYRQAKIRDTAMSENVKKRIADPRVRTAVVVTGGFHSEGIEKQLCESGALVITFAPKITKVDTKDGSSYLSVFSQEKTPLQKLFEGDRLFLSPLQFPKDLAVTTGILSCAASDRFSPEWFHELFPEIKGRLTRKIDGQNIRLILNGVGSWVVSLSGGVIKSVQEKPERIGLATAASGFFAGALRMLTSLIPLQTPWIVSTVQMVSFLLMEGFLFGSLVFISICIGQYISVLPAWSPTPVPLPANGAAAPASTKGQFVWPGTLASVTQPQGNGNAYVFRNFEEFLTILIEENKAGRDLFGLNVFDYPKQYGPLAIHFLLRDLNHVAPTIPVYPGVKLAQRSPQNVPGILNQLLGDTLYYRQSLTTDQFFKVLSRLQANAHDDPQLSRYQKARGLLQLTKEMAEEENTPLNPTQIWELTSTKNAKAFQSLWGGESAPAPLEWSIINFPYQRLQLAANELVKNPTIYQGVPGILRLAKWLADHGEATHLGQLFSAFGGDKAPEVTEILAGTRLETALNWEFINFPFDRLQKAAQQLVDHPHEYEGVPGMLRLAKWLADQGEATHLGQLFSAFGGDKAPEVTEILTGTRLKNSLGWETIDFPYDRLQKAAQELVDHPQQYEGVPGMLRLAKWLADQKKTTHLGQLFSAFGSDRAPEVTEILTGTRLKNSLNWEKIDFPYDRLQKTAEELVKNPTTYQGVPGMLRLAKWLADQGETTYLAHLFSAFGGDKAPEVTEILTGKRLEDNLNWEKIEFPYDRLQKAAQEMVDHPQLYQDVPGMLRLAKWLAQKGEVTHLGQVFSAFGGDKAPEVTEILTGTRLKNALSWELINIPYDRLQSAAEEVVRNPTVYRGFSGMLRLGKWLKDRKEATNLGQLFSAFGGGKAADVTEILTGIRLEDPLAWEAIDFPYDRLQKTAQELVDHPQQYQDVPGMLRLTKWLATKKETTNPADLFTSFGGDKGPEVTEILTGKRLPGPLRWKKILFPYHRLQMAAQELVGHPHQYQGVPGMLRLAKWLAEKREMTNLGHLFSAFGRDGAPDVTEILTGTRLKDPLNWKVINLSYHRLQLAAQELLKDPQRYHGVVGMLRFDRWLADQGEATDLGNLFSAFGGTKAAEVLGFFASKEVNLDLEWVSYKLSYRRAKPLIARAVAGTLTETEARNQLRALETQFNDEANSVAALERQEVYRQSRDAIIQSLAAIPRSTRGDEKIIAAIRELLLLEPPEQITLTSIAERGAVTRKNVYLRQRFNPKLTEAIQAAIALSETAADNRILDAIDRLLAREPRPSITEYIVAREAGFKSASAVSRRKTNNEQIEKAYNAAVEAAQRGRGATSDEKILEAVKNLMSQEARAALTIDDIAAEAGLTPRTIYRRTKANNDVKRAVDEALERPLLSKPHRIAHKDAKPAEERILDALVDLTARLPTQSITRSLIIATARVSNTTFYRLLNAIAGLRKKVDEATGRGSHTNQQRNDSVPGVQEGEAAVQFAALTALVGIIGLGIFGAAHGMGFHHIDPFQMGRAPLAGFNGSALFHGVALLPLALGSIRFVSDQAQLIAEMRQAYDNLEPGQESVEWDAGPLINIDNGKIHRKFPTPDGGSLKQLLACGPGLSFDFVTVKVRKTADEKVEVDFHYERTEKRGGKSIGTYTYRWVKDHFEKVQPELQSEFSGEQSNPNPPSPPDSREAQATAQYALMLAVLAMVPAAIFAVAHWAGFDVGDFIHAVKYIGSNFSWIGPWGIFVGMTFADTAGPDDNLPPHWNREWPVPTDDELSRAEATLSDIVMSAGISDVLTGWTGFVNSRFSGSDYSLKARTLRAIYFRYPELAAAILVSIPYANHGNLAEILDSDHNSNEPALELDLIGGMANRGLSLRNSRGFIMYKDDVFPFHYDISGFSGVLGYLPLAASRRIIEMIHDDNLPPLLNGMVFYLQMGRIIGSEIRGTMNSLLSSIPRLRLQSIQAKLSPEARDYFHSIDILGPPARPAPLMASESTPRVNGKAVGPLYLFKEEPSDEELRRVPHDAVVAMPFLPTSDPRVGPFRGILTFYQEGETSHAQMRARLWGIPHALWPGFDSLLPSVGKKVFLEVAGGVVTLREAMPSDQTTTGPPLEPSITLPRVELNGPDIFLPQGDARLADPALLGYKAALLNQLASRPPPISDPLVHLKIETGAALPFSSLPFLLQQNNLLVRYETAVKDLQNMTEMEIEGGLRRIRQIIEEMRITQHHVPFDFYDAILFKHRSGHLLFDGVFVRASTNAEDLPEHPGLGAGIYGTVPNAVGQDAFWKAISDVYRSVWSDTAYWERRKFNVDQENVHAAIWLVPSVRAPYSFVIHTSNVSADEPRRMVIEIVQGLGESLVGSDPMFVGFPTRILLDKSTHQIIEKTPSAKTRKSVLAGQGGTIVEETDPSLEFLLNGDAERVAKALAEVGEGAEEFFGGQPQEIEGVLQPDRPGEWTIVLLQTRAIAGATPPAKQAGPSRQEIYKKLHDDIIQSLAAIPRSTPSDEKIIDAVEDLLLLEPPQLITMTSIAGRAAVTRQNVYIRQSVHPELTEAIQSAIALSKTGATKDVAARQTKRAHNAAVGATERHRGPPLSDDKILEAVKRLLAQGSSAVLTVEGIAKEAHVFPGTIYRRAKASSDVRRTIEAALGRALLLNRKQLARKEAKPAAERILDALAELSARVPRESIDRSLIVATAGVSFTTFYHLVHARAGLRNEIEKATGVRFHFRHEEDDSVAGSEEGQAAVQFAAAVAIFGVVGLGIFGAAHWMGFGVGDAERILRALVAAVQAPWLVSPEADNFVLPFLMGSLMKTDSNGIGMSTDEKILTAVREILAENPTRHVSLRQIAARARVSYVTVSHRKSANPDIKNLIEMLPNGRKTRSHYETSDGKIFEAILRLLKGPRQTVTLNLIAREARLVLSTILNRQRANAKLALAIQVARSWVETLPDVSTPTDTRILLAIVQLLSKGPEAELTYKSIALEAGIPVATVRKRKAADPAILRALEAVQLEKPISEEAAMASLDQNIVITIQELSAAFSPTSGRRVAEAAKISEPMLLKRMKENPKVKEAFDEAKAIALRDGIGPKVSVILAAIRRLKAMFGDRPLLQIEIADEAGLASDYLWKLKSRSRLVREAIDSVTDNRTRTNHDDLEPAIHPSENGHAAEVVHETVGQEGQSTAQFAFLMTPMAFAGFMAAKHFGLIAAAGSWPILTGQILALGTVVLFLAAGLGVLALARGMFDELRNSGSEASAIAAMAKAQEARLDIVPAKAETLLSDVLSGDVLSRGVGEFGVLGRKTGPANIIDSFGLKLSSPNPFVSFLAERALMREFKKMDVQIDGRLRIALLRAASDGKVDEIGARLGSGKVIFVPPAFAVTDQQLSAALALAGMLNIQQIVLVMEQSDRARGDAFIRRIAPDRNWRVATVQDGGYQKQDKGARLELNAAGWTNLSNSIPQQGSPLAIGRVTLGDVKSGWLSSFRNQMIQNLMDLLPGAGIRMETILNIEGIVGALTAA